MKGICALFFFLIGSQTLCGPPLEIEVWIVNDLRDIERLNKLNEEQLFLMSQKILQSKLAYKDIKTRMIRYLKRGILPFLALERAIFMEQKNELNKRSLEEVLEQNGDFVQTISRLKVAQEEKETIIKVYAYCVHPWKNIDQRYLLAPRIIEPVNGYRHVRHKEAGTSYRTRPAKHVGDREMAYSALLSASEEVARSQQLTDMEKVLMAKCMSEQALRFFRPLRHPLKTIKESAGLYARSPERAFFAKQGVCNNFCMIAYNIAQHLNVHNNLFLATHYFHTYLELKVGDQWYHTHPFSSHSESDFILIRE